MHQQPPQPFLGGPGAAARRGVAHAGAPAIAANHATHLGPHVRRLQHHGVVEQPQQPRPEGGRGSPHGTRTRMPPSARRSTTASSPTSRADLAGADRRHRHDGLARPRPIAFGSLGQRVHEVEVGGHGEGVGRPGGHLALDPVDAERALLAVAVVEADDVPEPVAGQQPVRIELTVAVVVPEPRPWRAACVASNSDGSVGSDDSTADGGPPAAVGLVGGPQLQEGVGAPVGPEVDGGHRQLEGLGLLGREIEVAARSGAGRCGSRSCPPGRR